MRVRLSLLAALAVWGSATTARADEPARPQLNLGLDVGVVGSSPHGTWDRTNLFLGARGDLLFGRSTTHSLGLGPMVSIDTFGFHAYSAGGGLSVLLPVHDYLPLVLSGGAYAHRPQVGDTGVQVFGAIGWGARSFNYDGLYNMSGGIFVELRRGVTGDAANAVVIAAHLDAEVLTLPIVLVVNAFR